VAEKGTATTFGKPAARHNIRNVKQGTYAQELNSVIEPGVDVAADVAAINNGLAKRVGDKFIAMAESMAFIVKPELCFQYLEQAFTRL